jgi:hypothetical protein
MNQRASDAWSAMWSVVDWARKWQISETQAHNLRKHPKFPPQIWRPAEYVQSDFTHMDALGVTIAGEAFPHLVFHMVLPYSNWEAVNLCFSESLEALADGMEKCLQATGGVAHIHRTDNLRAAINVPADL